ncbi:hypothetical protein EE612_050776, partial [Oryza sativa]
TRLFLTPACPPPPRAIAVEATTGTSRSLLSPSGPPPPLAHRAASLPAPHPRHLADGLRLCGGGGMLASPSRYLGPDPRDFDMDL